MAIPQGAYRCKVNKAGCDQFGSVGVFLLTDVAGSFANVWAGAIKKNQAPMLATGLTAVSAGLPVEIIVNANNVIIQMMLVSPGS